MTPAAERYTRIQQLFDAVVDLPPAQRSAVLEEKCAGDVAVRQEVESLLAADAQAGPFDEQPPFVIPADLFSEDAEESIAGRRFGVYELIREIGRGGLGVVCLAARADHEYRKEVAIKLIRRGLDTDDILRRFRNERQILAHLDHPNIARLVDGGTTDDGLPYFVMEYVAGEPVNTYCDAQRLETNERLDLFRKVCAAVAYAHQNLVIHRDLKPSNILVTADGEPKLLDFGIAKLVAADDDQILTQTAPALRVMTPEYASPEQIKGEKITTTSDVYSLGVLLFELLTGQKPYRLKTRTAEELSRAILDQEPERPSSAVAANRESQSENRRSVGGDLDNIVLKALRKEPGQRYPSVEAFSEDIRRHREGLPVFARPQTASYRAGKFIRRNRVAVIAALLIFVAVVAGLIATARQSAIAGAQRAKAEKRFSDVRKLANSYLFDVYPEIENLQGSLKAREKILRNALTYLDSLSQEAGGDLELQAELATAYEKVGDVQGALNTSNLGKVEAGLASYAKATALREAVLAESPANISAKESLANNYYITARTLWSNSQTKEAEDAFEKALKLRRELAAAQPDSKEFKNRLAVLLIDYGAIPMFNFKADKALALFNEAIAIIQKLQEKTPDDPELKKTRARGLRILSKAKGALNDYAGGLAALDEAAGLARDLAREFPKDFRLQRSVWLTDSMTCELMIDKEDGTEAVRTCLPTIDFPKEALRREPENGVVAFDLAVSEFNVARAQRLAGNHGEAITHAREAIAVMSKLSVKSPADNEYKRNIAIYQTEMARAQVKLGQIDDAIAVLIEVTENMRPVVEADPLSTTYQYDLGMAHRQLAAAFHQKGQSQRAVERADQAMAIFVRLRDSRSLRESDQKVLPELEEERAQYLASVRQ